MAFKISCDGCGRTIDGDLFVCVEEGKRLTIRFAERGEYTLDEIAKNRVYCTGSCLASDIYLMRWWFMEIEQYRKGKKNGELEASGA